MSKTISIRAIAALFLLAVAPASFAALEWPEWTRVVGTTDDALATFSDGRSIQATLNISSIKPAGDLYAADPVIPGQPGGGNPSYILAPTGVPGEMIFDGDVIASFDLSGFPVDTETSIGIADMVSPALYRLEILDAASNPLSLENLVVDNYNLFYPPQPGGFVADLDIQLDALTGLLTVSDDHDAGTGSTYIHSGLAMFSNLPSEAAIVRILSGQDQLSEGVQWYFAGSASIPVPPAVWLLGSGLLGLIGLARRRQA